jgi:hypothetical protein
MATRLSRGPSAAVVGLLAALLPSVSGGCSSATDEALAIGIGAATTQIPGVTFRTALRGNYVGAQGNGGGAVIATATVPLAWETFTLLDRNGGALASGDEIHVQSGAGPYFQAVNGGGGDLNAASANRLDWETFRIVKASGNGVIERGDVVGLQTITSGSWVSAQNGGGGPVFAYGGALGAWERFVYGGPGGATPDAGSSDAGPIASDAAAGEPPDFGPNVLIFDPSMPMGSIQSKIDEIYDVQASNHFGRERYAYLFKPGRYDLDVQVGFSMQVLGLGRSPDDVRITGAVRSKAGWFGGNATQNFWRSVENMAVVPTKDSNVNVWAVSQATSFRRMHVMGAMGLSDNGWSSGGFIADSKFDVSLSSGTQQQFLTRNSALTRWNGGSWNMVFVGDQQAPGGAWPSTSYTVIDRTPVIREKPYLVINDAGKYSVIVPPVATNSQGITWGAGASAGTSLSTDTFYVAHPNDAASAINAALGQGKNLMLTPGIYHLVSAIQVTRPGTIVMGLGLATLVPDNGNVAMEIADVDGVSVSGILFDAGPRESPTLLRVGEAGSARDHAAAPTSLHDLSCRVGGAGAATTASCLTINSNQVIADNLWLWRADHGDGVDWYVNKAKNGIIVNGNDVTAYGLFVEHFQEYQTIWNGNGGRVYFYQSELPYDPPSQAAWKHGNVNGWASYKVADAVTTHDAWGLGVYCVFYNPVAEASAIETPNRPGVTFHHMITEWLGVADSSSIDSIINGTGGSATKNDRQATTP